MTLYDMHCHMGFANDARVLARDGAMADIAAFCSTVGPKEFEHLQTELSVWPQFRVGLGLHPWWVADERIGEDDVAKFEELAPYAAFIGEIGLDFAGLRGKNDVRERQRYVFERALRACMIRSDSKLISFHAVHATTEMLNTIEQLHVLQHHTCIFHWFSGSLEELKRALKLGCFFSVNMKMIQAKRGVEIAKNIPTDRLLIETDKPAFECDSWNAQLWAEELNYTIAKLSEIREESCGYLKEYIELTGANLLKSK